MNDSTSRHGTLAVYLCVLLFCMAAMIAAANNAAAADDSRDERQLPIAIEADSAEQDEQRGLTIYRGNVTVVQGALHFEADKVEIHSRQDNAEGKRRVSRIATLGKPAKFSHHSGNPKSEVVAQADAINYQPESGKVVMSGSASLVQQGSSVAGDKIEYFINDRKVRAAGDPQDGKTRVKTVITPGQDIDFDLPANSSGKEG